MSLNPSVISEPALEPVTLAEARLHVRADGTQEDDALSQMIIAARIVAENVTGKRWVTQTLLYKLDAFPKWELKLPEPPLASVTSVKYYNEEGVFTTLSSSLYRVITSRHAIEPAFNEVWPATRPIADAVEITYTAGTAVALVPATIKRGILFLVGHWFLNREDVVTGTISTEISRASKFLFRGEWTGEYV